MRRESNLGDEEEGVGLSAGLQVLLLLRGWRVEEEEDAND